MIDRQPRRPHGPLDWPAIGAGFSISRPRADRPSGIDLSGQFVLDDFSALHYKFHALKFHDIRERIAGNGDQVRVLPGEFADNKIRVDIFGRLSLESRRSRRYQSSGSHG
jgi:hypothetical protein